MRTFFNPIWKNKLKMASRLQCKTSYYKKLLEGNTGRTFFDINCSKTFLDLSQSNGNKNVNKWELIKLEDFAQRKP